VSDSSAQNLTTTPVPRLRVLFAIGSMGGGGAERQLLSLLQRIDRTRFEPLLWLCFHRGELLADVPADVPVFAPWDAFSLSFVGQLAQRLRLGRVIRARQLARLLREERIDIIYDRTFLVTLDTAAACRVQKTPRISASVADPATELALYGRRLPAIWHMLARRAFASASCITANSEGLRQRLVDVLGLPPQQISVIPNGIDLAEVQRRSVEFTPDWPVNRWHFVTVGRIDENKGHRFVLQALADLVHRRGLLQIQWHIVGQGPAVPDLQTLAADLKLTDHVVWEGFQPNPFPLYRASRLLVLSSLSEGLPNVLLEAMACGTPVLSTDCPSGPREILDNGRCGRLVPPGDSRALADAIADCITRPEVWLSYVAPARQRIERDYTVERSVTAVQSLLQEVAAASRPAK
jgi:glycosyltransferase involved in cell wall biosynthesis